MKHFLFVAVCLVGCTKKNENPTPSGANILAWDQTQAERESIRTAKTSDVKVQGLECAAQPAEDTAGKVKVRLETATVVMTEDGKEVTHAAPIKLGLTLVEGADYTFSDGKCFGPHYKLAAPGEAPHDMILHCIVK